MAQFGVYNAKHLLQPTKKHVDAHQRCKVPEDKIMYILRSEKSGGVLAKELSLSRGFVDRIKRGARWSHAHRAVRVERFDSGVDIANKSKMRWRRYSSVLLDQDDMNQVSLMAAWSASGRENSTGYYIANSVANATRNAIRDDQRARNPSLGNGERVKSSAFVSTAVHDEAVCGKGSATVEACLESEPHGDVDLAIDLLAAVDKLPERLKSVIMRRYIDGTDQDQRDLAETDGVSRAYIGQLEQKALARLRKLLA